MYINADCDKLPLPKSHEALPLKPTQNKKPWRSLFLIEHVVPSLLHFQHSLAKSSSIFGCVPVFRISILVGFLNIMLHNILQLYVFSNPFYFLITDHLLSVHLYHIFYPNLLCYVAIKLCSFFTF